MILWRIIYSKKWCLHLLMFKISMMQHFCGARRNGWYLACLWIISTLTYFPGALGPWPAVGDSSWIYIATISSVSQIVTRASVSRMSRGSLWRRQRCWTRSPPGAKEGQKVAPPSHLPPWPLTLASLCLTTLFFTRFDSGLPTISYAGGFLFISARNFSCGDPGECNWDTEIITRGETTDELT